MRLVSVRARLDGLNGEEMAMDTTTRDELHGRARTTIVRTSGRAA
jgi:hypothetical protein